MSHDLLHHRSIRAPDTRPRRWLLLLHGIFGAGRNWNGVARSLVEARPDWGVHTVDLRGHGASPAFGPPHTLAACASDLDALARSLEIRPQAVLGHSFGGKVALLYGDEPAHGIEDTWVVDSTPEAREPAGSAWKMLEVLREAPGPFDSREDVIQAVESFGYPRPVAQWMAMNVARRDDTYHWTIDADQMEALLRDFFRTDLWGTLEAAHGPRIQMIRATESAVLDSEAVDRIRMAETSGRIHLHTVEGGHWLNADNPEAVVALLARELPGDT